jgi:hypothetical protein
MSDQESGNLKEVSVTVGSTINVGNYSSVKVAITETRLRAPGQTTDQLYGQIMSSVSSKFAEALEETTTMFNKK